MNYSSIDKIIEEWVFRNKLFLQTEYKDCEVRSVEVFGERKQKFQIWIDKPSEEGVEVHVWDYKKKRRDLKSEIASVSTILDEAFEQAIEWMEEKS